MSTRTDNEQERGCGRRPSRSILQFPTRCGWSRTTQPRSFVCAFAALAFALAQGLIAAELRLADAAEKSDRAAIRTLLKQRADVNVPQADGMTALHWAAYRDDLESAKALAEAKASVTVTNRYGVTPLSLACQNGSAAIAELLLQRGADPNTTLRGGETVLMTAARTGKPGAVSALLKRGADANAKERRGQTALMWAAADGHAEVVELLIKAGADIHATLPDSGFTPFFYAVRDGRTDVVRAFLKAGVDINGTMEPRRVTGKGPRKGTSALLLAVENGHFDLAVFLIEAGADPNDQRSGYTPLHVLTWVRKPQRGEDDGDPAPLGSGDLNSVEFIRKLVKHGADVNARLTTGKGGLGKYNTKGVTPFFMASATADIAYMKLLVELGANPSIANVDNCTPLIAACGIGVGSAGANEVAGEEPEVLEAAQLLLKLGADINAVDANGETAMHGAALKNLPKVVQFLADNGAKVEVWNKQNKFGSTPLMFAQGYRPGNFKPSFETVDAIQRVMLAAGVALPTNTTPAVLRNSDWEPVPAKKQPDPAKAPKGNDAR
jgi:ankyrin repeat protein